MTDRAETAWPSGPVEATMQGGWLHFYDPNGERAAVPLDSHYVYIDGSDRPIWHADGPDENGIVTVTPSIHHVGHWHSPNPVTFRLVAELKDPRR
jgi:hypothetical protein